MKIPFVICATASACALAAATPVEKIKNERVVALEFSLQPGESEPAGSGQPSAVVFLGDGNVELSIERKVAVRAVKRGEVIFREANGAALRATSAAVRFVRIEFPGGGDDFVWGTKGFAPDYKMIVENRYARVYDIHIPAGGSEPQHTHRNRVVVCLSGAKLRHVLPDGSEQDSSIARDDCLWRLGQTHVGKNIGATDLWVIAIEPK